MKRLILAIVIALLAQAGVWQLTTTTVFPADVLNNGFRKPIASLSFEVQEPTSSKPFDDKRLDYFLSQASTVTDTLRLYASRGGLERIPALAAKHALKVQVAAWLDIDEVENRAEIERVVKLANENPNVTSVLVGNETMERRHRDPTLNIPVGAVPLDKLTVMIREVKTRVHVPVSTADTWSNWYAADRGDYSPQQNRDHQQRVQDLVNAVDFIPAHILPYWDRRDAAKTPLEYAKSAYGLLRQKYPGKKIVIAEYGWPSQGYNNHDAKTGKDIQAKVIRDFIEWARANQVDYNIIEAFDQPWKNNEGSVGAYWGIFDADGAAKFTLHGPVAVDYRPVALGGVMIGALLSWFGLRRRNPTFLHALLYSLAANGFAAGIALACDYPFTHYINFGTGIMWVLGVVMVVPLAVMTLAKVNEISEVLLGRKPVLLINAAPEGAIIAADPPFVSLHVPAYKEQPEMLKYTLDTCAALDYPAFEVLVIMNNTTDPFYWRPVADHCAVLNERLGKEVFKFCHLPKVKGFKAGAMTLAYDFTDPRASILALIDADYAVHPHWLRDMVPAFDNPVVALVQAPQDHRDGSEGLLKTMMNWEYAGFFDIGMVQRNEDNAIVAHGTMLMLRRSAFEEVGGWSTDTIVEDTELGLRLYEAGYAARYTNRRYGWGVLPDTFKAFQTQRHRWAYGAIQIIKKHWRHMLPQSTTLTPKQKEQFVSGWFFWLSDSLGVAVAILNLIWVPVILIVGMTLPMMALTVPILTSFVVNVLHVLLLYRKRVGAAMPEIFCAAIAAMSLQFTVADAVMTGFITDKLAFARTDKGGNTKTSNRVAQELNHTLRHRLGEIIKRWRRSPVFRETSLGVSLLIAAAALWAFNPTQITEQNVFALTVAIQALPFLSATLMRWVELKQYSLGWLHPRLRAGSTVAYGRSHPETPLPPAG